MTEKPPTRKQWERLYRAAIQIREIEPWNWMEETDLFGVQDSESEEIGFVSVMGSIGEHHAVAVYRGAEGLYGFWDIQAAEEESSFELFLAIPQIQASFESRDLLEKDDYRVIKSLGLRFRGRCAWPLFRSYRPGYFPWFIDAEEARFLAHALEQTAEVAARFLVDDMLLEGPDEESYRIRVPRKKGKNGDLTWADIWVRVPPPAPSRITVDLDAGELDDLKQFPADSAILEVDCFAFPAKIGKKGERPALPYLILVVEVRSGLILGQHFLGAEPSIEAMWGSVPGHVVQIIRKIGRLPQEIRVRSDMMRLLLGPLADDLGIRLQAVRDLPQLEAAREAITEHFS